VNGINLTTNIITSYAFKPPNVFEPWSYKSDELFQKLLDGIKSKLDEPNEASIELVTQDKNEKFVINQNALEILRILKGKIAVCSIVGQVRTGKSYILNCVLNKKNAFEKGGSVNSCTRGIWMWNTPIKHKNKNGEFNLILLDTEGLGSPDRNPEFDNKLFVLNFLLSSYLIHNTKNVIDRDSIKKLAIIADLSKYINNNINNNNGKSTQTLFSCSIRLQRVSDQMYRR
jgi:hypothetical protein